MTGGPEYEPWTDDELAQFIGAIALRFVSEPEIFPVFRAYVEAHEPGQVLGHPLGALEVLGRLGREGTRELARTAMVTLAEQLAALAGLPGTIDEILRGQL